MHGKIHAWSAAGRYVVWMGLTRHIQKLTERKKLGEILVELKLLTPEKLQYALEKAKNTNVLVGKLLVEEGLVNEVDMAKALALQFGLQFVDADSCNPDEKALAAVPSRVAATYVILPLHKEENVLSLAIADPVQIVNLATVPELAGLSLRLQVAPASALRSLIGKVYAGGGAGSSNSTKIIQLIASNLQNREKPRTEGEEAPIAPVINLHADIHTKMHSIEGLLHQLLDKALEKRASDIHIESTKTGIRVRERIDGVLHESQRLPVEIMPLLISHIKILGKMDIAEKRQPQDGHFQAKIGGRAVDFRVSTLPTVNGEKAVLRILDKQNQQVDLAQLGMDAELQVGTANILAHPHGLVLVTGPTGSGKTTTIYSMIRQVNALERNIVTIEDPVEYQLENINQVQVNVKAGVSFSNTLRSVLRQDPDVIVVGEIRDEETAEIAVRAALTGHLVISTLHTNSAAGTLSRLVEMKVEPFLLSSSILGIYAQRLVRKLCVHCREQVKITEDEITLLGVDFIPPETMVYRAKGCPHCNGIGYKGRVAIIELLRPDAHMRKLISKGQVDEPIHQYLIDQRFLFMKLNGIDKIIEGLTTIEEVLKATA